MFKKSTHFPVLIVGGGLVGLSAALFLSRHNIPYLLIERHKKTAIHPRARGFNFRTMELYRDLGLEEEIRVVGASLSKSFGWYTANTLMEANLDPTKIDMPKDMMKTFLQNEERSPASGNRCTQDLVEPVLLKAARKRGGDLRFHTELTEFTQNSQKVVATLLDRTTGVEEMIEADYLIAADGANSPIRHLLEIPVTAEKSHGHIINMYFESDLSEFVKGREFSACNITHPDAAGILLAINNRDRWCYHVSYDPDAGEAPADFPAARCKEIIQKAIGLPDQEVRILSVLPWEAAEKVASRFQQGRVFLTGDAAHVMPPTGGYGANTGVQDAHNLAWKLAAVINKQASPALLETYDAERRPVAQMTVAQAGRLANNGTFSPIKANGEKVPPVNGLIVMAGYQYTSQSVIEPEPIHPAPDHLVLNGRPGTRAPHIWGEYQGKHLSILDMFGSGFVLLTGSEAVGWHSAARQVSEQFGIKIEAYRVGPDGDFMDKGNNWQKACRATKESVVLIRPDGFVCWRSDDQIVQPAITLEGVLAQILPKG